MIEVIEPGMRGGTVRVPASKSAAHRLLIAAALSEKPCRVFCDGVSRDIKATADCLSALGAKIEYSEEQKAFLIQPVGSAAGKAAAVPEKNTGEGLKNPGKTGDGVPCHLFCGESGTTLRFMLPLAAALGKTAVFHMEGLLPNRPMGLLVEELGKHGVKVRQEGALLFCEGTLTAGGYVMPGNVSSQFISGLLFALPLLGEESRLIVTERIESQAYITMTEQVLSWADVRLIKENASYRIPGGQIYRLPEAVSVESDWSSAAAFLCMGAMSEKGVSVPGMNLGSSHADKAVLKVLKGFGADISEEQGIVTVRKKDLAGQVIDASGAPDLVPVLSALACAARGETRIVNAGRLRFKESDRLKSTAAMLNAIGGDAEETEDGLRITGTGRLRGGTIDPANDHRIAMAAAVAASICEEPVTISDSECVGKSYPGFYTDLAKLAVLPEQQSEDKDA